MSQEKTVREQQFQNDILDQMLSNGWLLGQSSKYNRELALYPEDVEAFVRTSQPKHSLELQDRVHLKAFHGQFLGNADS